MAPVAALVATTDQILRLNALAGENGWIGVEPEVGSELDHAEQSIGIPVATADGDVPVVAWQCPVAGSDDEWACLLVASRPEDLNEVERAFVPLALATTILGAAGELIKSEELGPDVDLSLEGEAVADGLVFPELLEGDAEES